MKVTASSPGKIDLRDRCSKLDLKSNRPDEQVLLSGIYRVIGLVGGTITVTPLVGDPITTEFASVIGAVKARPSHAD